MPITPKQREWRRSHLGSSDSPSLFGVNPFKNSGDLYLEKTQPDLAEQPVSEPAEIGNMIEPVNVDWCAKKLGVRVIKNQQRVSQLNPIFAASFDALIADPSRRDEAIEAKTAGICWPLAAQENWGEDGSDEVSDYVVIQTHHQMLVGDLKRVWVPVLIGGRGRCLFYVERNETIIGEICERGVAFWERVVRREPPTDIVPSMNYLRRVRRQPNKIIPLDRSLVDEWQSWEIMLKSCKARTAAAKAAVLNGMGDAEGGEVLDGAHGGVTYLEQFVKAHEVKAHTKRVLRFRKLNAWRKYRGTQLPAPADSGTPRLEAPSHADRGEQPGAATRQP